VRNFRHQALAIFQKSPWLWLAVGSIISQGFNLISVIFMGKLYSPESFGIYSLVVSIAGLFAISLTFSYETFIVPAKSEIEAKSVFNKGVHLVFRNSIFFGVSISIVYFTQKYFDYLNRLNLSVLYLSTILGIVLALYSLIYQRILREQEFRILATRGPIQSFSIGSFQGIMNFLNFQRFGLVFGEIVGRLIGIIFLVTRKRTKLSRKETAHETPKDSLPNRKLLRTNLFGIILDTLTAASLILYVSYFFGDYFAGQLSMAQKIVIIPTLFFGTSYAQYVLANKSHSKREGIKFNKSDFDATIINLSKFGLLFAVILFVCGEWALEYLLGEEWVPAGKLVTFLLPTLIISFVWNPVSSLYYVYGFWVDFLKLSALRLLSISLSAFITRLLSFDLYYSVLMILCSGALVQTWGLLKLRQKFPVAIREL
jgi:O-antigen/teichoic acid export membrane protein